MKPFTLLYVEDEPQLRELLSVEFEEEGLTVLTAPDGIAALKLLEKNHVDVVVSDLQMPRLDGKGFRAVAGGEGYCRPKVWVAFSAYSDQSSERIRDAGFDEIFYKPLRPAIIVNYCRTMLLKAN